MKIGVIIAAAGSGTRMGAEGNKVLLPLDGKPLLQHSLECFGQMGEVTELVVVTREIDLEQVGSLVKHVLPNKVVQIIEGGAERQESVYLGLKALSSDTDWVVIHDGARPFITREVVRKALASAKEHRAAGVAVPVKDTIKQVEDGFVVHTPPRSQLWAMQTPQIFAYDLIVQAHERARKQGYTATDDCALVEALGQPIHIVAGEYSNIKITTPEDLPQQGRFLVGFGYDVHQLVEGRALILGGVEIPFEKGLLGHSDADVVTHALMDALLGAVGKGDIGELFPDTDPKYKGISSISLLHEVMDVLRAEQVLISNVDITIQAQRPKLAPWKAAIKEKLAQVLQITAMQINVKATTAEGLGFVGREEGIAVQAVVSLRSK